MEKRKYKGWEPGHSLNFYYTICVPGHVMYKSLWTREVMKYFPLQMKVQAALMPFILDRKVLEDFWGIENTP